MDDIRHQAVELLTPFKEKHGPTWTKFGVLVHANVTSHGNSQAARLKAVELLQSYDLSLTHVYPQ
jgi:hypothetical protein